MEFKIQQWLFFSATADSPPHTPSQPGKNLNQLLWGPDNADYRIMFECLAGVLSLMTDSSAARL